jgi:hypothetical protein
MNPIVPAPRGQTDRPAGPRPSEGLLAPPAVALAVSGLTPFRLRLAKLTGRVRSYWGSGPLVRLDDALGLAAARREGVRS